MDTAQAKDFVRQDNLLAQAFMGIKRTRASRARKYPAPGDPRASPDGLCLVTDDFLNGCYGFYLIEEQTELLFLAKKWFQSYLTQKFLENWPQVAGVVNGISSTSTKPQKGDKYAISTLLLAIGYKLRSEAVSMNDIIPSLYELGLVRANLPQKARAIDLTLAIVGWMSFLYTPRLNNYVDLEGHNWESHGLTAQPIANLLGNFGLPDPRTSLQRINTTSSKGHAIYTHETTITRALVRFHTLEIVGIKIKWVDTIGSHLQLDPSSRLLSVFRFPSYCLLSRFSKNASICKGLLLRYLEGISSRDERPEDLFREMLLSYYLIFEPTGERWRKRRSSVIIPAGEDTDPLLLLICAESWNEEIYQIFEDDIDNEDFSELYFSLDRFPVFRTRLFELQSFVRMSKPHSDSEPLHDRRNPIAWWAFWAVIVFAGIQLVLSLFLGLFTVGLASYQVTFSGLQHEEALLYSPRPLYPLDKFPPTSLSSLWFSSPQTSPPPSPKPERYSGSFGGYDLNQGYCSTMFMPAVVSAIIFLTIFARLAYLAFRARTDSNPGSRLQGEKTVVEWNCNCGKCLQDDYIELVPGAIGTLKATIQDDPSSTVPAHQDNDLESQIDRTSSNNRQGGFASFVRWLRSHTTGTDGNRDEEKECRPPDDPMNNKPRDLDDPLFLLVCIEKPNGSLGLVQIDLCGIKSDRLLFDCLRQHYISIRGRWLPYLRFRCLEYINFVQFELWPSEEVDVQPYYDRRMLPPESKAQEYLFDPPTTIPPIGPSRLMHLWKSPEHSNGEGRTCISRFPKRRRERLYVSAGEKPATGWGIHLVEGLDWVLIWMLIFVIVLIGSLVFSVAFAVLEHDIQSAFAISSYVVSFVTLGIGACSICGQKIVNRHCR